MSLATSVILAVTVVCFGVANVIGLSQIFDQAAQALVRQSQKNLTDKGQALAAALEASLATAITSNDWESLRASMAQVARRDHQVAFAYVADENGLVMASSNAALARDAAWEAVKGASDLVVKTRVRVGGEDVLVVGAPVRVSGQLLGTIVAGYSLAPLDRELAGIRRLRDAEHRAAWLRTGLFGLLFVVAGSGIAVYQGLRISRPIKRLAVGADEIAHGHLERRVPVTRADEIGQLGENFNRMADRIVVLLEETAAKATLEKELEVARAVQDQLVPQADVLERGPVKIVGYYQPASQCGGDWWTYHELADGRLLMLVGDVTGHGVPSAMITAVAKAACDTVRIVEREDVDVSRLLSLMNRAIGESGKRKFVMTCFASILDPNTRVLTYANAGHNFPYIVRDGALSVLTARGNRLGDQVESHYPAQTARLCAGDLLVLYTDGIVECEDARGEEYGEKRFRASLVEAAAAPDPVAVREHVLVRAHSFYAGHPHKDDITLVFGRVG
jgi:serine phosphatase RsbU (regulator of sigma subunit)